jgi:hypothetical protein
MRINLLLNPPKYKRDLSEYEREREQYKSRFFSSKLLM